MDATLDSGPNWHACLLLSQLDAVSQKLEVVDTWGYYGMPATESPDSMTRKIKKKISLDVSFLGNHGKFRHEETRYLDRGHGLHGHTYELNKDQYDKLVAHLRQIESDENAAIEEAATALNLTAADKFRIYRYEAESKKIFQYEKKQAEAQDRVSRLRAFEIRPGLQFNWSPVHFRRAKTCKSRAVEALSVVLNSEQIQALTAQSPAIPRLSGKTEEILLHSEGNLQEHKKKSGQILHYREPISKEGTRVFWSVPPQLIDGLSTESTEPFMLNNDQCPIIKSVVGQLQQIHWVLQDATFSRENEAEELINRLNVMSQYFSVIPTTLESTNNSTPSLFNPSAKTKTALHGTEAKIKEVQQLLNELYDAITKNDTRHFPFLRDLSPADVRHICRILNRPNSNAINCSIN